MGYLMVPFRPASIEKGHPLGCPFSFADREPIASGGRPGQVKDPEIEG